MLAADSRVISPPLLASLSIHQFPSKRVVRSPAVDHGRTQSQNDPRGSDAKPHLFQRCLKECWKLSYNKDQQNEGMDSESIYTLIERLRPCKGHFLTHIFHTMNTFVQVKSLYINIPSCRGPIPLLLFLAILKLVPIYHLFDLNVYRSSPPDLRLGRILKFLPRVQALRATL